FLDGDRDVLVATLRRLSVGIVEATSGWAVGWWGRPAAVTRVVERGTDHREQRDTVVGDHGQQWVLLPRHQRGQRADRTPHLLAFAWAAGRRPDRRGAYRGVDAVQDGLREFA